MGPISGFLKHAWWIPVAISLKLFHTTKSHQLQEFCLAGWELATSLLVVVISINNF